VCKNFAQETPFSPPNSVFSVPLWLKINDILTTEDAEGAERKKEILQVTLKGLVLKYFIMIPRFPDTTPEVTAVEFYEIHGDIFYSPTLVRTDSVLYL